MRLDDHFGSGSTLQRNERVKLAVLLLGIMWEQAWSLSGWLGHFS